MFAPKKSSRKISKSQSISIDLKNLNSADSGTGSGEIDLLIRSDYLWQFVSGKVKCGTGDEAKGVDTILGYVLSGPEANVEGIIMGINIKSITNHYHPCLINIRGESF